LGQSDLGTLVYGSALNLLLFSPTYGERMLSLMELEEMALRQFTELSGGERQKVLIARALAQEPQVLLLDEPTSNLDLRHQLEVLGIVRSIVKEKGIAAVMAIHDLNLAARFSDKLIFLDKGRIYDAGEPAQVLTQENIRRVYGVEAIISKNSGHPHIISLAPVAAKESQIPRR
jgi:iron complex transport system ATP-binding protein